MIRYIPSHKGVGETSVLAVADHVIEEAANEIMAKAKDLAEAAGLHAYAASLEVTTGTRPKGRGYREVVAKDPDAATVEWGDTGTARLRILGQASGIQVFPDVPK